MGTFLLYSRAKVRLDELAEHLSIRLPPVDMLTLNDTFSTRKKFASGIAVAVFAAVLVGFTTIITDKVNSTTIASSMLGGYLTGFIAGDGIYMFVNFPSAVTRFYLVNVRTVYKLAPVETAGLFYLFSITVDFMLIGSLVTAVSLLTMVWYLANATSTPTYFPAVIGGIFAAIIASIMLFRSINIFTNHIRKEKLNVLSELQILINRRYEELDKNKHDSEIYENMGKLITIYNDVKSSPSWPFEASIARNTLASFLVPFFPALIQLAIDWVTK